MALMKGGCGHKRSQALLSLYTFSWLKLSMHICGLFNYVWILPVTSALSELVAYFIFGVSDYHILLAVQLCVWCVHQF